VDVGTTPKDQAEYGGLVPRMWGDWEWEKMGVLIDCTIMGEATILNVEILKR